MGRLQGNIQCQAKVVIGSNGSVEGDISGQQADIMGQVSGTIKVKELLQLKGGSHVNGNLYAGKLQIEPSANFNGQCHMTTATNGQVNEVAAEKKAREKSFRKPDNSTWLRPLCTC